MFEWLGRAASASARSAAACGRPAPHTRGVAWQRGPCRACSRTRPMPAGQRSARRGGAAPTTAAADPRSCANRGACAGYAVDPPSGSRSGAGRRRSRPVRGRSGAARGEPAPQPPALRWRAVPAAGPVVCRRCGYGCHGRAGGRLSATGGRAATRTTAARAPSATLRRATDVRQHAVRADLLEAAVWREVKRLLRDPGRIAAEHERRLRRGGGGDLEARTSRRRGPAAKAAARDRPADRRLRRGLIERPSSSRVSPGSGNA